MAKRQTICAIRSLRLRGTIVKTTEFEYLRDFARALFEGAYVKIEEEEEDLK